MRLGSRPSGNTRESLPANQSRRSASARSITPASDVSRPPSNAAVTFLRQTAGNENGKIVSSVMASVAGSEVHTGWVSATESYATSAANTTLASPSKHPSGIRRGRGGEARHQMKG